MNNRPVTLSVLMLATAFACSERPFEVSKLNPDDPQNGGVLNRDPYDPGGGIPGSGGGASKTPAPTPTSGNGGGGVDDDDDESTCVEGTDIQISNELIADNVGNKLWVSAGHVDNLRVTGPAITTKNGIYVAALYRPKLCSGAQPPEHHVILLISGKSVTYFAHTYREVTDGVLLPGGSAILWTSERGVFRHEMSGNQFYTEQVPQGFEWIAATRSGNSSASDSLFAVGRASNQTVLTKRSSSGAWSTIKTYDNLEASDLVPKGDSQLLILGRQRLVGIDPPQALMVVVDNRGQIIKKVEGETDPEEDHYYIRGVWIQRQSRAILSRGSEGDTYSWSENDGSPTYLRHISAKHFSIIEWNDSVWFATQLNRIMRLDLATNDFTYEFDRDGLDSETDGNGQGRALTPSLDGQSLYFVGHRTTKTDRIQHLQVLVRQRD